MIIYVKNLSDNNKINTCYFNGFDFIQCYTVVIFSIHYFLKLIPTSPALRYQQNDQVKLVAIITLMHLTGHSGFSETYAKGMYGCRMQHFCLMVSKNRSRDLSKWIRLGLLTQKQGQRPTATTPDEVTESLSEMVQNPNRVLKCWKHLKKTKCQQSTPVTQTCVIALIG